eukprot:TRINITY_DN15305_c0_g1_i2.p1 TRINITY_DN15305_c0_g1~~TRINITY_DN15305_c0_g1_i2.p1  ORF type:complete len:356 (-),score=107.66 TRINITY_DN15305_c0_g1_i2:74-1141(-)
MARASLRRADDEEARRMENKLDALWQVADAPKGGASDASGRRFKTSAASKPAKLSMKDALGGAAAPAARPAREVPAPTRPPADRGDTGYPASREQTGLPTSRQAGERQDAKEAREVAGFLAELKLDRYTSLFLSSGFDSMEVVREMQETHMKEIGMAAGHVLKLQKRLSELRPEATERAAAPTPSGAASPAAAVSAPLPSTSPTGGAAAGSSLLDGPAYDEEAATQSFQEAVRAFRGGGGSGAAPRPVTPAAAAAVSTSESQVVVDDRACCYQCYRRISSREAIEREDELMNNAIRKLCSESCAMRWSAALEMKKLAARKRQARLEKMEAMSALLAQHHQDAPIPPSQEMLTAAA